MSDTEKRAGDERSLSETVEAMARYEVPYIDQLHFTCEKIGYGRVIQLAEQWMNQKHPGWIDAKKEVYAGDALSRLRAEHAKEIERLRRQLALVKKHCDCGAAVAIEERP